MRQRVGVAAVMAVAGAALVAAAGSPAPPAATPAKTGASAQVERGRYLATAGLCNDCHTPKKMGPNGPELMTDRLLSGHREDDKLPPPPALPPGPWMVVGSADLTAWSGPWGISYTANLTPDQNTGIGIWTEDMFVKAIRTGRHMGVSRPILPPMPWQMLTNYTDDDLKAIFAYLKSLPPVKNRVPDPVPPAAPAPAAPAPAK